MASGTGSSGSPLGPSLKGHSSLVSERIIVMNKRDLVAEWGIEVRWLSVKPHLHGTCRRSPAPTLIDFFSSVQPFRRAMGTRFPEQRVIFASWNRPRDVKNLHEMIVSTLPNIFYALSELSCRSRLIDRLTLPFFPALLFARHRHCARPCTHIQRAKRPRGRHAQRGQVDFTQRPAEYGYPRPSVISNSRHPDAMARAWRRRPAD